MLADICLQVLESVKMETGSGYGDGVLDARAKAVKGLVELVRGDLESCMMSCLVEHFVSPFDSLVK